MSAASVRFDDAASTFRVCSLVGYGDVGILCMEIYLDCYLDVISNGGFVYLYLLGISIMYEVVHSRNTALSNIPLRAPFSPFEI